MNRRLLLALALLGLAGPAYAQEAGAWKPFQELSFLVGSWSGAGEGSGRIGGKVVSFTNEVPGVLLIYRGKTIFPALEGKAEETSQETGVFAYDGDKRKYEATIFFSTGVWGTFDVEFGADGTVRLVSSRLVNFAPGSRARLSFTPKGPGELAVLTELAAPGQDFAAFSSGKLTKK